MTTTIIKVTIADPDSLRVVPALRDRVMRFSEEFGDSGVSPDLVWAEIVQQIYSPNPYIMVLAGLDESDSVIGHAVLRLEQGRGMRWVLVEQYHTDRAVPVEQIQEMLSEIEAAAANFGAVEMRCLASRRAHVRAYERFYGFHVKRVLMTKPLARQEA